MALGRRALSTTDLPNVTKTTPFLQGGPKKLLIGGRWVPALSGKTIDGINPSNGAALPAIAAGGAEDVDLAVAAARRAFEGEWSRFKPVDRQALLMRMADVIESNYDELGIIEYSDMGAPISRRDLRRKSAANLFRYYAAQAYGLEGATVENSLAIDALSYTAREPVGVVGAIIPWNGPIGSACWKIAVALAAGCTIVLKPSEDASLGPLRIAELFQEVGLPDGVLNVITGYGRDAGAAIAAHPGVDKVAFTGSTATGQQIARAATGNFKRLSLELGGKSPDIVFADADLEAAVPGAAMGIFANSGQVCSAGSRLFVERKIYDEFVERVAEFGRNLKVGDSLAPETQIGPVVSKRQMERIEDYLALGEEAGAQAVAGGSRLTGGNLSDGYFIAPTVLKNVRDDMRVAREEIFGPVLVAMPFDDVSEVVSRANDTEFGLGAGVWTQDITLAHRLARRIKSGNVWVNCYGLMDPAMPFGGYKMSGYGREGGRDHVNDYTNTKAVWIRL